MENHGSSSISGLGAAASAPVRIISNVEEDDALYSSSNNNDLAKNVTIPDDDLNHNNNNDGDNDDDDLSEYSYEDDEDGYVASFLDAPANSSGAPDIAPATIEADEPPTTTTATTTTAWREPTKQAVSMSLRAEQETQGGKRRLAQDLYRILASDTEQAGYSLRTTQEDRMDCWTIELFQFDVDSHLAKDLLVMGLRAVELEMTFPEQYPFEPPFVRVTRPRFKKQTGFVMNGALCMELLTKDGWNPINDIESVIVSIRSLLVVGDGRLEGAMRLSEETYAARLAAAQAKQKSEQEDDDDASNSKRQRVNSAGDGAAAAAVGNAIMVAAVAAGSYSATEAAAAYTHLSDYHKKKGWDASGWWAKKG